MATNTLLQYLEGTGEDAFGNSVSLGSELSNRRQVETFMSNDTIAIGDAVSFDLAQAEVGDKVLHVKRADTGSNNTRCGVGIALNAAAVGDKVAVVVAGLANAKVKGSTAIGDRLSIYSTTAGVLEPYQASFEDPILAVAATAESGGLSQVVVLKQF